MKPNQTKIFKGYLMSKFVGFFFCKWMITIISIVSIFYFFLFLKLFISLFPYSNLFAQSYDIK